MVDIEPYKQIKKTNIQEHNDLVAKINEIIDVVNQTNLETIVPKIVKLEEDVSEISSNDSVQDNDISSLKTKTAKLEQDISGINATDSLQWNDIENVKTDIGTINPKITKLEQDIISINDIDTSQSNDINSIKAKNTEQDNSLATHANQIDGITKSLVSNVILMNGTTTGNMKVRIEREDAPSIDSDDYNIQKPTSIELVQGSASAMVKAQITLSDGTVLVSDDFMFTTEAIGQDVYISSFVFKNGNVDGTISADIGLSNGSSLTANNFAVPTDPNVTSTISDIQSKVTTVQNDVNGLKTTVNGHTSSINELDSDVSDLQTRMTAVEKGSVAGFDALKATVDGHTASISALDSDVADLQIDKADANNGNQSIVAGSISATNITKGDVAVATVNDIPVVPDISVKADLNNSGQTIVAGTINATNINKNGVAVATTNDIPDISGKVNISQGTGNAGKVLGVNASGNVEPISVSSGEVWEEVNLSSIPYNWNVGDRIKVMFKMASNMNPSDSYYTAIIELYITQNGSGSTIPIINDGASVTVWIGAVSGASNWNSTMNMPLIKLYYRSSEIPIYRNNSANYIHKMWRLKK